MMKRDLILNSRYLISIGLLLPLIYIMNMPFLYIIIYGFITLALIFNTFYYDSKNNVIVSIVSMPLDRQHIVLERYLFFMIILSSLLIYHFLIDSVASFSLPYLDLTNLSGNRLILLFTGFSFMIALLIPIYYLIQMFTKATMIQATILFISGMFFGVFIAPFRGITTYYSPVLDLIATQQYLLIPFVLSIICLYASYRLSVWIFTKRDIL